uniref:Uncharacterized protein n=1 Tax=Globisporangium ultimum (strain ATCC 200006 / CBS 805.95 / DAOM BR144) TaxID=431595 RepID=K3XBB2_GLOUD
MCLKLNSMDISRLNMYTLCSVSGYNGGGSTKSSELRQTPKLSAPSTISDGVFAVVVQSAEVLYIPSARRYLNERRFLKYDLPSMLYTSNLSGHVNLAEDFIVGDGRFSQERVVHYPVKRVVTMGICKFRNLIVKTTGPSAKRNLASKNPGNSLTAFLVQDALSLATILDIEHLIGNHKKLHIAQRT